MRLSINVNAVTLVSALFPGRTNHNAIKVPVGREGARVYHACLQ